jgi:hypothetical protein
LRRAAALLLLWLAWSAHGGELEVVKDDVKSLTKAPFHWTSAEWQRFGEGVGAVAIVMLADKQVEATVQRNRTSFTDAFAHHDTPFGGGRALQISVLMLGTGYFVHDRNLFGAGRDACLWTRETKHG